MNKIIHIYHSIPISLRHVFWFSTILLSFHFLYRALIPFVLPLQFMTSINHFLTEVLYNQSAWINRHLLGLNFTEPQPLYMLFDGKGYVEISAGCSGFKQFYQVFTLFLLFQGPWKHKLWYIPLAMLVMHLVNIFRIVTLSWIVVWNAEYWQFSHDYILRPLFYVFVFGLWVIWVEKLLPGSRKR